MLEAEIKLRISEDTARTLQARLLAAGARAEAPVAQRDIYFAHPGRDFSETDEALRLRLDERGLCITYKGPKLDPPRKTREEIEFPLGTEIETAARLLERLGFSEVAQVEKQRTEFILDGPPRAIVSLDRIEELGTFCEIEVSAGSVEEGRDALAKLSQQLEVTQYPPIARSYLELLSEARD